MPDVEVEVVKPFMVHAPDRLVVSDTRADDLKRGGLVRDPPSEKAAPVPQNKGAPAASTKAGRRTP